MVRDKGYEYIRPILEGYEGGDDETQVEEMSVVSSITDCFMQTDEEEREVPRHPPRQISVRQHGNSIRRPAV